MSTHAQIQVQEVETGSKSKEDTRTSRGLVYAQIVKQYANSGKIRWTTKEMIEAVDGEISEYTVRDAFREWTEEEDLLRHVKWSRYWYLEPSEWF